MNPIHFLLALLLLLCGHISAPVDLKYLKARWHTNQGHLFNTWPLETIFNSIINFAFVFMILLTGNVLALFEGVALVAVFLFIPFGLLFWYLISRTKFYKETYSNGNPTKKLAVSVGMIAITFGILLLIAYTIFKIIAD